MDNNIFDTTSLEAEYPMGNSVALLSAYEFMLDEIDKPDSVTTEAYAIALSHDQDEIRDILSLEKDSRKGKLISGIKEFIGKMVGWFIKTVKSIKSFLLPKLSSIDTKAIDKVISKNNTAKKLIDAKEKELGDEKIKESLVAKVNNAIEDNAKLGKYLEFSKSYLGHSGMPDSDDLLKGNKIVALGTDDGGIVAIDPSDNYSISTHITGFGKEMTVSSEELTKAIDGFVENEIMKSMEDLRVKSTKTDDKDELKEISRKVKAFNKLLSIYSKMIKHIFVLDDLFNNKLKGAA